MLTTRKTISAQMQPWPLDKIMQQRSAKQRKDGVRRECNVATTFQRISGIRLYQTVDGLVHQIQTERHRRQPACTRPYAAADQAVRLRTRKHQHRQSQRQHWPADAVAQHTGAFAEQPERQHHRRQSAQHREVRARGDAHPTSRAIRLPDREDHAGLVEDGGGDEDRRVGADGDGQDLDTKQPGVTIHYQVLRNLLGDGLLTPLPGVWQWVIYALLLAFVFLPSDRRTYAFAFIVAPVAFLVLSVTLITVNWYIPALSFTVVLWVAVGVGAVADGMQTLAEKNRFKQSFSGSVSPAVLQEMLAGNLSAGISAKTAEICVVFSDIRGFTGISESLSPEAVTSLLTRYFDRMVDSVHRFDGTMDKFMGDGMMVLFGAPRSLANPCESAVRCGFDMVEQLRKLNEEFAAEGLPPVEIGIGINYGKAVVGNIGSTERHNYSAIGDAVNVASRIEGLTKRLGSPIVMTEQVRAELSEGFEMIDFGEQALRGHTAMRLWGVKAVAP